MIDCVPCVKKPVRACLRLPDGRVVIGENLCHQAVDVCPRDEMGLQSGEGYNLCTEVCQQIGHAEIVALNSVNHEAEGGIMVLFGHTYACDACMEAMVKAGVHALVVYDTGEEVDLLAMRENAA